jgi:hypothetical protein
MMKTTDAPAMTHAPWWMIAAGVAALLGVPAGVGGIASAASPAAATGVLLGDPDSEGAGGER